MSVQAIQTCAAWTGPVKCNLPALSGLSIFCREHGGGRVAEVTTPGRGQKPEEKPWPPCTVSGCKKPQAKNAHGFCEGHFDAICEELVAKVRSA